MVYFVTPIKLPLSLYLENYSHFSSPDCKTACCVVVTGQQSVNSVKVALSFLTSVDRDGVFNEKCQMGTMNCCMQFSPLGRANNRSISLRRVSGKDHLMAFKVSSNLLKSMEQAQRYCVGTFLTQ